MAGNYYGFEERKPESQVNWFNIGKQISDSITTAVKARETKKEEFETGFKTALEDLSNVPLGLDVEMQNKALQLANVNSEALRQQYDLVKDGKLSLNDFTKFKQNSLTGTKSYFEAIKNFNATAAQKQQNLQSGKSQVAEGVINEYLQKFANFKEYDFFVGPDGNTYMGKKEKKVDANGKEYEVITKNPNDIISTSAAKNMSLFTVDKFNTDAKANELSKGFGSFVNAELKKATVGRQGIITTVEDIRKSESYNKMKQNAVASVFANKFNRLSVLTEDMAAVPGNPTYYPTFDREEFKRDKSKVLLVPKSDGTIVPEFHEEQIKKSDEFFGDLLESKLDRKEDIKVTSQLEDQTRYPSGPSEAVIKASLEEQEVQNKAMNISDYTYGSLFGPKESRQTYQRGLESALTKANQGNPVRVSVGNGKLVINRNGKNSTINYANDPFAAFSALGEMLTLGDEKLTNAVVGQLQKRYWSSK